jgi:hypothetical protein
MKITPILSLAALLVLIGAGCSTTEAPRETATSTPVEAMEQMEEQVAPAAQTFGFEVSFTNVSDMPEAEAQGYYDVRDGETRVAAIFNIDAPAPDYFYEGWLVCGGVPFSTGALTKSGGVYENLFASTDLPTPCQLYVLTIEPDDGDPAPAGHVFDGKIVTISEGTSPIQWDFDSFSS